MTQTFWIEPVTQVAWGLRRYTTPQSLGGFTCETGYHDALVYIGRAEASLRERVIGQRSPADSVPHDDPRWPGQCSRCEYRFAGDDHWQPWDERIWTCLGAAPGQTQYVLHQHAVPTELGIASAPPGACWDATWMPERWRGPDGISLMVRLPDGHDWSVDSNASNCNQTDRPHKCWVRHGDPKACHVTVDKNGDTCTAGGGSIQSASWHGFLRDGVLVVA